MISIINVLKKNNKILLGILIGTLISGLGAYAVSIASSSVSYDNTTSGASATDVKGALDELYSLANRDCKKGYKKGDETEEYYNCVVSKQLGDDSWETIISNVRAGKGSIYELGSTKTIDMGSFGTHTLRVSNTTTPAECATEGFSQTACGFVLEFADIITTHVMNSDSSGSTNGTGNKGGWEYSEMRTYVNNDIYNALPSALKSAIIETKVVSGHGSNDSSNFTTTDKLYLLSTHEVWDDVDGNTSSGIDYYDTAYNNTRQLDYYKSQKVTNNGFSSCATCNYTEVVKKDGNSNNYWWWLRSVRSSMDRDFIVVGTYGDSVGTASSHGPGGVAPAFRIG